jgi:BMFP domain-containing protein YqiC
MRDRPKFFDDLAGVAGGAFSAFAGMRDELETLVRTRIDEAVRRFDLVKRDDLDAALELAANARAGQEAAEARLAALEARVAALETARSRDVGIDPVVITPAPLEERQSPPQEIPPPMDV